MTTILDRIRSANHVDRVSKSAKRKGQTTAQKPVVKRIITDLWPKKETHGNTNEQ